MSGRRPTHAVVHLAALDMRARPDHRSELRSQLLMGEVVRVIRGSGRGNWWWVENVADRYRGWVRTWGLTGASSTRAGRWTRMARGRVIRPFVAAMAAPGSSTLAAPLFLNSRVIAGARRGRLRSVELPDGRRGWIPAAAIETRAGRTTGLTARVRSLLGIPYLWGGRTPLGFDCSGFIQQVLIEQGLPLPRDAQEQFRVSAPIPEREFPRAGDLLFFGARRGPPGHVGLHLGGGYFAHARGQVRISSIEANNILCDKELMEQFLGFRRPVRTAQKGFQGGPRAGESA